MNSHPPRQNGGAGSDRARGWAVVSWGAYLACSWTWCIGMFLPILLVRDYGPWAFVVFAAPNVVGAAAMGWVLRPGAAEEILERHRHACRLFSAVTIAFQLCFLNFVGLRLFPLPWGVLGADLVLLGACFAGRRWAPLVWAASLGLLVALGWGARAGAGSGFTGFWAFGAGDGAPAQRSLAGLALLAPVCVFGFALCPYLDLTFLRARRELARRPARRAFTLGFGVLFLAMIIGTLVYAPTLVHLLDNAAPAGLAGAMAIPAWAVYVLVAHLFLQLVYTIGVHAREYARSCPSAGSRVVPFLLGSIAFVASVVLLHDQNRPGAIGDPEAVYRSFMAFYGLVFPAYVWICMIPSRDRHGAAHSGIDGPLGRRKLAVFAVCVLAAMPMYWLGFIDRDERWLAPGLALVLIARLAATRPRARGHTARPQAGAPPTDPARRVT